MPKPDKEVMTDNLPNMDYRNELIRRAIQQMMSVEEATDVSIENMQGVKQVTSTNGSDELHYFVKNANPKEYQKLVDVVLDMYD